MKRVAFLATVGWLFGFSIAVCAQQAGGRTFALDELQHAAIDTDPRMRELELEANESALRIRTIDAGRLPAVTANAQAQYQSDVPTAPLTLPNGQPLFSPSKATYDGFLRVDQSVFDAAIGASAAVERASRAEAQARVKTSLFQLRQRVNDAFFAAATLQARAAALDATLSDLEGRLTDTNARVQSGAALPADAAMVEATLLSRREDAAELRADRHAALATLAKLTGQPIGETDTLTLPNLAAPVAAARQNTGLQARPEYAQFARTRDRLLSQEDLSTARSEPRVSAFARVGYGRPGLNFISNQFESYGLAGIQLQWAAWTWGTPGRDRQVLDLERQISSAEEAAFTKTVDENTASDMTTIDRLQADLATDDRIIVLREQVEHTTDVRFREGVVTAAEYLDRSSELLQARTARASHEVELAEASARLLTTLGLEAR